MMPRSLKIIFDTLADDDTLAVGWGLSCLIDDSVLFDTGQREDYLARNLDLLKVNASRIEDVVISHDHWDHTGGLAEILARRPNLRVHLCRDVSEELTGRISSLKGQCRAHDHFAEIVPGMYVTGSIAGQYKEKEIVEQALVVETSPGLVVLTGCAHPGIVDILKKIKEHFQGVNIHAVLGGFHLLHDDHESLKAVIREFRRLGVNKVGPTHCSGSTAMSLFSNEYKGDYYHLKVGETIVF